VHGQGERVLYVDDDDVMRLMVERILQRAGWQPTCTDSVGAAQQLLAQASPPFALLVTDYNMPGASGLDLARSVRQHHPKLPIIIASGYLSEELHQGAEALGVRHLVGKQDLFEELAPLVQRALNEARAG
jgi:CheY-like chemotaxis protein